MADSDGTLLHREWTIWYDKRAAPGKRRGAADNYESNLQPIGSFGTVEEFWRLYSFIRRPLDIDNANYHVFKSGIKPMWEDPANKNGGKWVVNVGNDAALNCFWENLLLALIGETVDPHDEVCGCVLSRRKYGDKIAVWNKSKNDRQAILDLGRRIQDALSDGLVVKADSGDSAEMAPLPLLALEYQHHEDSLRTGASYTTQARISLRESHSRSSGIK